ncbi:MAG: hypothetical protein K0U15_05140, partial [Proteobacteria bacterium]|nr:hypothetical protein [Pseudomonadota bacterium]
VLGASGNVTYGFVGTQPTQYVLSPVSGDDTQIVVSLQAIVNAESTSTLTIRAIDNNAATVSITVEISSEHPETETFEIALVGREYGAGGLLYVHHLYDGVIASIRVTNLGKFSGLSNSNSNYTGTHQAPDIRNNPYRFRPKAGSKELEMYLDKKLDRAPINNRLEVKTYNYKIEDNHSGNGEINTNLVIRYVSKLALDSTGISVEINSKVGGTFATIQVRHVVDTNTRERDRLYHGRPPYVYTNIGVDTDSSLSTQLSAALTIEPSNSNLTAELSINPVAELTENALVTATIRLVDGLNVTVFYVATLNILVPLTPPALETVTVQRTYTANDFHTPPPNGGIAPHTYVINAVQSDNSALDTNSFNVNSGNGALRLANPVTSDSTATVEMSVSDSTGSSAIFTVIVELIDNNLSFIASAATATIRSTDNSGNISSATAVWGNGNIGAISYTLGATDPAAVSANFAVNQNNGALILTSALGSAQTVSVEIIAYSDSVVGIEAVTAIIVVEVIPPFIFADANNPQAAVIATTYAVQDNLFAVNANSAIDIIGIDDVSNLISYSVSDSRFSVSDNVINLISAINTTGEIALAVVASETASSDTGTLIVTVNFIDPPALNFSASNIQNNAFVASTAKIADLAISGGLPGDYAVNLLPANNANFAVDYNVGENTAVLNLTNDAITGATILSVTVVLDDQHPRTTPKTLAFTVAILSQFSFGNDVVVSAAYRTELDNNIALLTLRVFGAEGNVTYDFVGTPPARYVLAPVSGDNTQIIVSLQAGVNSEGTSNLNIRAVDGNGTAADIIVEISSEHPQTEEFIFASRGLEYGAQGGGSTPIHHLYTGVLGSIRVSNPGKFSGLAEGSNYTPSFNPFNAGDGTDIDVQFRKKAGGSEQSQEIEVYLGTALGGHSPTDRSYAFRVRVADDHTGNGTADLSGLAFYLVRNKFSLAITGISISVNSDVGGALATIQIADNDGDDPFVYEIIDVNTDSLFSTQLSAALTVDTSNNGRTGTLSFNADTEITENAKVTATVRIVDQLNVTAYYGVTLDVFAPFSLPALETITVQRTNTAGFYTPNLSGTGPYHYNLEAATNPNIPILVEPTDGELRLVNALGFNDTTTLGIGVREGEWVSGHPGPLLGTLSLVVEFIGVDSTLSFISTNPATVTVRSTDNSDIISDVTAIWENGNIGVINYRLGATNPAAATANFAVNESNGALMLASALGSAQTVSVEIIAYPDFIGVDDITATIVVESIVPITFADANNPQAAVIATTYVVQDNLFAVNANSAIDIFVIGNVSNSISYSVSDNRFSVSDNVINLISA